MAPQGSLRQLYRAILLLHKAKLPPPMREMGDRYVKAEFNSHIHGKTSPQQWDQFVAEWLKYHKMLSGQDDQAPPQRDVLDSMNPEQQAKMSQLYKQSKELRKQMIDDVFPSPK